MSNDKKFKGTPGPWMFHERPQGEYHYGYTIGDGPTSIVSTAWGEANARLIAAAPDLLEALQALDKAARKIASWNGLDIADADEQFDGIFERSETAIAKAIGE